MVVLGICEKIEPICLSKKLGLYVSNLKDCPYERWDELVADEFIKARKIAGITMSDSKIDHESRAYEHFKKQFPLLMQGFSHFSLGRSY